MATCGEVLVRILENYGIDTVFGIPGVHTVEVVRTGGARLVGEIDVQHRRVNRVDPERDLRPVGDDPR